MCVSSKFLMDEMVDGRSMISDSGWIDLNKKYASFGKLAPSKGTLKITRPPKRDRISRQFEGG